MKHDTEPIVSMKSILTERQLRIIQMRFWEGMTQEEIGEVEGVSQQHVQRIISGALRGLRGKKNLVVEV